MLAHMQYVDLLNTQYFDPIHMKYPSHGQTRPTAPSPNLFRFFAGTLIVVVILTNVGGFWGLPGYMK
jgi:hypothetical protein